ncbi:MAG: thymidylate kinase [bacterium]|nr:thymidylate kinase [bacterium]
MTINSYPGKFIVLEGLDGSGKFTQLKLLVRHLRKNGKQVAFFDFPKHGERSAALVDNYLNGKYGSVQEVGPYRASIFYACDRYDSSFSIKKFLKQGKVVVSDRYFGSNLGHQAGKINNSKKRKKFVEWLYNLEYDIFGVPKPNLNLVFNVPPELSLKLANSETITDMRKAKRRSYLGKKRKDIHEKDINHLKGAFRAYMEAVKKYPKDYKLINCLDDNKKLLPPEFIHERIWQEVKKVI